MAKIQRIAGSPQDFGKLGKIGALAGMSWAKIPTYYYDFTRFELPLTDVEFAAEFGPNRPVFDISGDTGCNRQTNAAVGSGVNEAFVALGTGIIAMGEGEAFAIHGARIDRPAEAQATPAALVNTVNCGSYCGIVDTTTIAAAENPQNATLWWGAPTWRFIEKFFQAYRLQVLVNHRFQIVDESLFDVGMLPLPAEFVGASDSLIPTMPFIRAVNDVMAAKSIDQVFIPGNVQVEAGESICVPPPNASVTYGHPRIIGIANRIYCFQQPILFLPGMRFEVLFQNVEDAACYRALQNSVTANCTTADATLTNVVSGIDETCAATCTIPGGTVSLGVVFKGFALWPQACVEYLANYLVPNSMYASMYLEGPHRQEMSGLLGEYDTDNKARKILQQSAPAADRG